jgi:large subunit ribosomal protein L29
MKAMEFRKQNRAELIKQLANLREQARDLRFKTHSKEVKNTHTIKNIRQDIARILTILKQQENQA